MTAKLSGTNGLLQQYDYQTPATGFSYTFAAGTQMLFMVPSGTLASGTITMPSAPEDGMVITFSSSQQITALTLQGNTGQSVSNAVTFLPAQTAASYVYRLANTTWYPCQTVPGTGSQLVSATAQNSTSGTSIVFTGIPSWTKRITVMFNGVSTNGTSNLQVQLGTGGTPTWVTSGYTGAVTIVTSSTVNAASSSVGFGLTQQTATTYFFSGTMFISSMGSNVWAANSQIASPSGVVHTQQGGSSVTLGATLTALRITTVGGTDAFDAGSINLLYE